MIIRGERPSDIQAICEVAKAAFDHHPASQQTAHFIIRDLRAAGALDLSLVSEVGGRVVGHIAFSPVRISDGTRGWMGLGPVSVLPKFQGRRIGTALVNKGLARLTAMATKGCALVGLPTYYTRFGFRHYPQLIHEGPPGKSLWQNPLPDGCQGGTLEFHEAFKQLSIVEKDTIADVIIDYEISGIKADLENPAVESLMEKKILTELPDGRVMLQSSALAAYDTYFGKIAQFRATEMSRVHKNPLLRAITS